MTKIKGLLTVAAVAGVLSIFAPPSKSQDKEVLYGLPKESCVHLEHRAREFWRLRQEGHSQQAVTNAYREASGRKGLDEDVIRHVYQVSSWREFREEFRRTCAAY